MKKINFDNNKIEKTKMKKYFLIFLNGLSFCVPYRVFIEKIMSS